MKNLAYSVKACLAEWLIAAFLGPLLLLAAADWGYRESSSPFADQSFVLRGLWVWAVMLVLGFLLARRIRLPGAVGARFLPLLAPPLLIAALWAAGLYVSQGNYLDFLIGEHFWSAESYLAFPSYELMKAFWDELFYSPWNGLRETTFAWIPQLYEGDFWYLLSFNYDASGLAGTLSLHGAVIVGFAAGQTGAARRISSWRGAAPVVCLCLAVAAGLFWQLNERAESLVGRRAEWSSEPDPALLSNQEALDYSTNPFNHLQKIAVLDKPASLRIGKDYPRLDGATAFAYVYAAFLKATYELPAGYPLESAVLSKDFHLFSISTSRGGYTALIEKKADIFFGLEPSEAQRQEARRAGVGLRFVPIGKEAFVFFTSVDNPIDSLTLEEARGIYSGKIRNWKELGGDDAPILAFQRPENSGSQTIMENKVMNGESMITPPREELIQEMGGLLTAVADYRNGRRALGYSFRWYVTALHAIPGLKLLPLDGIAPTPENIASGRYPVIAPFYAVVREGHTSPQIEALLTWIAGPEGQELVSRSGYVPFTSP